MSRYLLSGAGDENLVSLLQEQSRVEVHIRWKAIRAKEDVSSSLGVTKITNVVKELTRANRSIPCKFKSTDQEARGIGLNTCLRLIESVSTGFLNSNASRGASPPWPGRDGHIAPAAPQFFIPNNLSNSN
jgi:hypothetical protein